nr:nucleobase-ascorbate transporter 2 isoform X2 [Ipomoea trifida]
MFVPALKSRISASIMEYLGGMACAMVLDCYSSSVKNHFDFKLAMLSEYSFNSSNFIMFDAQCRNGITSSSVYALSSSYQIREMAPKAIPYFSAAGFGTKLLGVFGNGMELTSHLNAPVVYAHNDLLFSNLMLNEEEGEAIAMGFQHYIMALGTAVMIPSFLVPFMGGDHRSLSTMRAIQGALIVASSVQIILGYSQLWAIFSRFFSPLGMVPVVSLVGLGLLDKGFQCDFCPLITYRKDRETNQIVEVLDGKMLREGYLYKKVSIDSLCFWGVMPFETDGGSGMMSRPPSEASLCRTEDEEDFTPMGPKCNIKEHLEKDKASTHTFLSFIHHIM